MRALLRGVRESSSGGPPTVTIRALRISRKDREHLESLPLDDKEPRN